MKNQKIVLIGLILPFFPIGASFVMVVIAFSNYELSSIIAVDKLILLTAALSPVVYILGAGASITALLKSEMKLAAMAGVVLNIGLLIHLLYFSKAVLMEFSFII